MHKCGAISDLDMDLEFESARVGLGWLLQLEVPCELQQDTWEHMCTAYLERIGSGLACIVYTCKLHSSEKPFISMLITNVRKPSSSFFVS